MDTTQTSGTPPQPADDSDLATMIDALEASDPARAPEHADAIADVLERRLDREGDGTG